MSCASARRICMASPRNLVKRVSRRVWTRFGVRRRCRQEHMPDRRVCYSHTMLPRYLFRILSRVAIQPYFRLTRGQTLGVRGVVIDESGRFLLVRHTYVPGWMLPGGGVDKGESLEDAVVRELREETGVLADGRPRLISVHTNFKHFKGDHVAVFVIESWVREETSSPEIAETGFFSPEDLPEGTTIATRTRIAEIIGVGPPASDW